MDFVTTALGVRCRPEPERSPAVPNYSELFRATRCAGVRGSHRPRSGRGYGDQKPVRGVALAMLRTYVLRSAKWLRPPPNPPRLSRVQRLISATSHRSD